MVNEEHYARLKEGVEAWNKWRLNEPDIIPHLIQVDLSGLDLSRANFSRANLRHANFSAAKLNHVNLCETELEWANFNGADLREVDLRWANLNGANLREVYLEWANFSKANLSKANLCGANLRWVQLIRANLCGAKLNGANLSEVNLNGANLTGAELRGVELRGADLREADLREVDLSGLDLSGLDLSQVNLSGAKLTGAELRGADLRGTELSKANLRGANLRKADLRKANLRQVNLNGANLNGANLNGANLNGAKLRGTKLNDVNLSQADLSKTDLSRTDLSRANLKEANLREADLSGLDLSGLDLREADLREANLTRTQALSTEFTGAKFTGACLEDWNINSATNLDNIDCQYVYRKTDKQERRPSSGEFAPGEFTKLFQKALETVDLIFADGIDWKAFLVSFQELQSEYGEENLSVQAVEKKSDSAFVIRLEVPPEANKAEIEFREKELYQRHVLLMEAQIKNQENLLNDYKKILDETRKDNTDLKDLIKTLADNRPTININMEAKAESNSMSESYQSKYDQRNSNNQFIDTAQPGSQPTFNQYNYTPEQRQNIVEAAKEIEALLQYLQQSYLTTTTSEKMSVVGKAVDEIERNPTLKARVIGALKAGGTEGLKELVDNPLINILLASIEGWQEAE